MKTLLKAFCGVALLASSAPVAAPPQNQPQEQTWRGQISDDNCGPSHAKMLVQHKAGNEMTPEACVLACVKTGAKYVFVLAGKDFNPKIYQIANQDFPTLKVQAGHTVEMTGTLNGDTITVSTLMVPPSVVHIQAF